MSKRSRNQLCFIFYFAVAHLVVWSVIAYVWEGYVLRSVQVLHPSVSDNVAETVLTWIENGLEFPFMAHAPGQFDNFLETALGSWAFLLMPLNSLLWALAAFMLRKLLWEKAEPEQLTSNLEGESWPPAPRI